MENFLSAFLDVGRGFMHHVPVAIITSVDVM